MTAATVAAWLLTYLLHSAVLLGVASLGCALLGSGRLATQEAVLRAALLGALATATLSLAVGAGGVFLAHATPAAAPRLAGGSRTELAATPAATDAGLSKHARIAPLDGAVPWPALLVGLWVTGAGLGVTRLAVGSRRLRSLLADRRPLPPGRLVRRLAAALGLSRPVRLSLSRRIAVPFAVGFTRPEVCVPERTLDDLSPHQREALIAHELAHHARRDPAWLAVSRVVEAVLFVQPLNRLAVRRLQQLAECQCDDAAARTTGRPLDLARCLVEVARWAAEPPEAVAALSSRCGLGRRVERLMAAASPQGPRSRWLAPCLAVAVTSLGLVLPGVDLGAARPSVAAVGVQDPVDDPPQAAPAPAAARPAPQAPPRPSAAPRPAAAPAPEARPAPPAPPDAELEHLEQELERLMERVSERVDRHRLELERLEGLIEAMTARLEPHGEELERLGDELGRLAEQRLRELDDQLAPEQKAAVERQMRELEAQMRETLATFKPTTEEIARLAAEARALAEESRPSPEELAEIESYAREMAERTSALAPTAEGARELAREAREEARAELETQQVELERQARETREEARAEAEAHRTELERQLREERQHARERALEKAEAERDAERDRQRAEELERQAEERPRQDAEAQPTPTPSGGES